MRRVITTTGMGRRDASQRGLTLVELLVTIIIAGIAFAALVPVFVLGFTVSSSEKARLAALNVAQDKIEKIRQLRMPVLIVHGVDDRYVPPRLSEALYAAAPSPKKLLLIPNGTHNNSAWTGDADYRLALRELFGPIGLGFADPGESVVAWRPAGGMTPVNRGPGNSVLESIGTQR